MKDPQLLYFAFFVLGWSYYMVASILMHGSIFEGLRRTVERRAKNNRFFLKVKEMLGCLMCTATQASIWTLGVTTFTIGLKYDLPETAVSAMVNRPAHLSLFAEVTLMLLVAFAASVAVSGEAWIIKTIFEYNKAKYERLRNRFHRREEELLAQIHELEFGNKNGEKYDFDLST